MQVLLRIQLQANRIHLTIQVNSQLRDTRNRASTRQNDLAAGQNQAARQCQLTIQPRVPHHAAVHLDVDLAQPSGVVDCTDGFTENAGESVCATHNAEARVLGNRLQERTTRPPHPLAPSRDTGDASHAPFSSTRVTQRRPGAEPTTSAA